MLYKPISIVGARADEYNDAKGKILGKGGKFFEIQILIQENENA